MTYSLNIPSHVDELQNITLWLEKYLPDSLNEKQKNNILLLAQELVSNGILHGNQKDVTKKVMLKLTTNLQEVTLSIQDEGKGIGNLPTKEEAQEMDYIDENGRGLKLAVLLSDDIHISHNTVTLHFNI